MCDSPINFMINGHTESFLTDLESKNHHLKAQMSELMSLLTCKKQENLKYLHEIDNQQELINSLNFEIEEEERKQDLFMRSAISKQLSELNCSKEFKSESKYRIPCKSMEIPNKHVYLDANNRSIESSFDARILEKKTKMEVREIKLKVNPGYSTMKDKKSMSTNRFKFK